eukprot:CAMPEP_0195523384 /NCGR_PEP_ID=MMETSP0794_2-20130614/22490_1 /TAXON_ID=515487 /ORGANISM="Stephanopyxis turris, Strain CCMP 815" /LENGTH=192 /DNA_ID=CAMNT_0040653371 /DNA_START=30 /DNA_END=605 /DNA_ORIENTATION=+
MNRFAQLAILLLSTATTTDALAPSTRTVAGRRNFFGVVASSVAGAAAVAIGTPDEANAAPLKVGPASPFTGDYDDPNHPGCLRQVKVVGAPLKGDGTRSPYPYVEVVGYDGKEGAKVCSDSDRPTRDDLWRVSGRIKSNTEATIDFSAKGGPTNLAATWDGSGIVFPDGNKWTKSQLPTNSRRPKDMSTLKS